MARVSDVEAFALYFMEVIFLLIFYRTISKAPLIAGPLLSAYRA